jgi:CheY-like chemotaxis protein
MSRKYSRRGMRRRGVKWLFIDGLGGSMQPAVHQERLAENKPDLVVLDFMMPLLDGPGMARAMRAEPAYAEIPIIMMSAVAEPAIRERFDGYAAFFRKPFRIPALLETVAEISARQNGE